MVIQPRYRSVATVGLQKARPQSLDLRTAKGNLERALADESMAIQLGTTDRAVKPIYYVERGDTFRYKGELDLAVADYDQALRIAPDFIAALVGRGLTYEKKGDLGQARIPSTARNLRKSQLLQAQCYESQFAVGVRN